MRSSIIDGLSSVAGKAGQLTMWSDLLDEPDNFGKEIDRYENVTLEDVKKVYLKYIKNKDSITICPHLLYLGNGIIPFDVNTKDMYCKFFDKLSSYVIKT